MDTVARIKEQISSNPILLYMKGVPDFPQCGFSAQVVNILQEYNVQFAYVDVLENPDIRQTLPKVANWPTFPQLYVSGELIGGCDIVTALHEEGKLQAILNKGK